MSAMKVIHEEEKKGGTLIGFSSWCGGLPAPEANDNPFGYKFSWAPRGVLTAAKNSAKYLKNGKIVEIPSERLFSDPAIVDIPGLGKFEGYPNRDSVSYIETYGFRETVKDMFRGTLRNLGHCKLYTNLIRLGLFEDEPKVDLAGMTYLQLMEKVFGKPPTKTIPAKLGISAKDAPLEALEYIGMLGGEKIKMKAGSLLDVLADRMNEKLQYQPGERDLLIMRHDISFGYEQGRRKECVTALMVDYGIPKGDSSMSRTVSLPAAIAVRMLLDGKIADRGVLVPIQPTLYEPILAELALMNIFFKESRVGI
jgi:saccharopine dehydrogenase-like NADP-dependent oxidoreductase